MQLIHKLKTSDHVIPLNLELALDPAAFATYHKKVSGELQHSFFGWRFNSEHEAKYKEHQFELQIEPEALDRVIEVLTNMRARYEKNELPIKEAK